jgi:hypothetical protein
MFHASMGTGLCAEVSELRGGVVGRAEAARAKKLRRLGKSMMAAVSGFDVVSIGMSGLASEGGPALPLCWRRFGECLVEEVKWYL